jgi:hypothetical protein
LDVKNFFLGEKVFFFRLKINGDITPYFFLSEKKSMTTLAFLFFSFFFFLNTQRKKLGEKRKRERE